MSAQGGDCRFTAALVESMLPLVWLLTMRLVVGCSHDCVYRSRAVG